MTKESSFQTFRINQFVKKVYRVVKILPKYNKLPRKDSLLIWNTFYLLCKT